MRRHVMDGIQERGMDGKRTGQYYQCGQTQIA